LKCIRIEVALTLIGPARVVRPTAAATPAEVAVLPVRQAEAVHPVAEAVAVPPVAEAVGEAVVGTAAVGTAVVVPARDQLASRAVARALRAATRSRRHRQA
jgi:hypothetical protein